MMSPDATSPLLAEYTRPSHLPRADARDRGGEPAAQSVAVPVLRRLQADYGTRQVPTTWLITGFPLSSGVAIPILGRPGDTRGRRRVSALALATLAVGTPALTGRSQLWITIARSL